MLTKAMLTKAMAADAIMLQDASNPAGVINEVVRQVATLAETLDNATLRKHPYVVLLSDKLDDLCRLRSLDVVPTDKPLAEVAKEMGETLNRVCAANRGESYKDIRTDPDLQTAILTFIGLVGRSFTAYSDAYHICQEAA